MSDIQTGLKIIEKTCIVLNNRYSYSGLYILLMESGSKYSILKEEKFLSGHPL